MFYLKEGRLPTSSVSFMFLRQFCSFALFGSFVNDHFELDARPLTYRTSKSHSFQPNTKRDPAVHSNQFGIQTIINYRDNFLKCLLSTP